jgi:hypothetical protein
MLKIQEFIGCFDDIKEANEYLKRNVDIDVHTHVSGELFLYKPGRRADMTNALVREANCLILDGDGGLMAKAWNHPGIVKTEKDFPSEFVFGQDNLAAELPDGELVVIYNIEGKWCIGTADSVDAQDYLPNMMSLPGFTWSHEIKNLLARRSDAAWDTFLKNTNPFVCFVLSYVTPYNTKVMPILKPELFLLTCINTETGQEFTKNAIKNMADRLNVPTLHCALVNGSTGLSVRINMMRTFAPGLMLDDSRGHRVMIRNPIYSAIKSALDAGDRIKPIHIAKVMQFCRDRLDFNTIGQAFNDFEPMLSLLRSTRSELLEELNGLWLSTTGYRSDAQEFAARVHHHPLNYMLFMYKDKKIISFSDELSNLKTTKLIDLVKNKHPKEFDGAERLLKLAGGNLNVRKEKGTKENTGGKEESGQENGGLPF